MGTDIHTVFQRLLPDGQTWEDVPSEYDEPRQYALFAWLGNVRNGFGFAGTKTHTPITPLQDCRGLPADFTLVDGDHGDKWLGDHSHGWLLGSEILSTCPPSIMRSGIVSREWYNEWDGQTLPTSWCGAAFGDGIVVSTPETITSATTHVQISWLSPLLVEFSDFLNEIKRLTELHGEIRMVFGFDS